jgi:glycosyltransferase involved in cell wall biosynthesis
VAKRLKVIVGAYACNPTIGTELGVGWGWVESISRYHDLWVLTGEQNREDIEAELNRRPELAAHLHFEYIHRKRNLKLEKFGKPFYLHTYKHQWLHDAFKRAREKHAEINFDLAHQLTYIGFRFPGYLWQLDIPFVWGPIGGLEQTNWHLLPALGLKGAAYYTARNLLNDFDRRFRRLPRLAFQKASGGVIAATSGIEKEIRRFYSVPSTVIPEIGIPPIAAHEPTRRTEGQPLQLVWSGNHLPGKALPLLLKALSIVGERVDWRLTVLGSGPCMGAWRKLSGKLGLEARIHWTGQLRRDQALLTMQQAHVLVITSVYDLTSTVLVEALSNGLPVICPDHCGFRDAIDETCGIKVPIETPAQLIDGFAKAVVGLSNEDTRYTMAMGAVQRSEKYAWEFKSIAVDKIYNEMVSKNRADLKQPASAFV